MLYFFRIKTSRADTDYMKIVGLFLLIVATTCCGVHSKRSSVIHDKPSKPKCFTAHDTILNSNSWIKYVERGNGYVVELKINGLVDTMDIAFDCKTNNGLIPKLYKVDNEKIFLSQGVGFHYRKLTVCIVVKNKISYSSYEVNRVDEEAPDVFVYKEPNKCDTLFIADRVNGDVSVFPIDSALCLETIGQSMIYKDSVVVLFTSNRKMRIIYPPAQRSQY